MNSNLITFIFNDGRHLAYEYTDMLEIGPSFFCHRAEETSIQMPEWLSPEDISSYISIFHQGIECIGEFTDLLKLLKISEYFENESYSSTLINEAIIPKLSLENSLQFLQLAYNKLSQCTQNTVELDNIWFDFFCKSLEIVGKHLSYYFKNNQLSIIRLFDKKILDELYDKYASQLISGNYLITEDLTADTTRSSLIKLSTLESVIAFISEYRRQSTFYDLITNEYMKICSEDNITELNSLPNPIFLLKLQVSEIDNYYEEFTVDLSMNSKKIVFIIFYRRSDDSFNVAFKLIETSKVSIGDKQTFKIVTFLSSVSIDELSNNQINVKSISNNKSMHSIFKVNSCKNLLFNQIHPNSYLTLKIYLKPCFLHSMLTSFLLVNFAYLYKEASITKLSKQLMVLVFKNKNTKLNDDKIVYALLNWLNDEINIKEDITEIVENIKWGNVSLSLLFEFVIKYGRNIINEDIEHIFIKAFEDKGDNDTGKNFNRNVMEELIKAAKKANYSELYSENQKMAKLCKYNIPSFLKEYSVNTANYNQSQSISVASNKSNISMKRSQIKIKPINSNNTNSPNRSVESNSIKTHPNIKRNKKQNIQIKHFRNKEEKEYFFQDSCDNNKTNPHNRSHNNQLLNQSRSKCDMKSSQSFSGKQAKPIMTYITKDYLRTKKSNEKLIKKNKSCLNVNINTKLTISNNMSFFNAYPNGIIQTQPSSNHPNYYSNATHKKNISLNSNTPLGTSPGFINTPYARTQTHSNVSFGNGNSNNNGKGFGNTNSYNGNNTSNSRPKHKISLITQMNKMKIVSKTSDNKKSSQTVLWNNNLFNK